MRSFRLYERASRSEDQSRRRKPANRRGLSRHLPFQIATAGRRAGPSLGSGFPLSRDPVLTSRVPLPDSWRVLKMRKDSDSHPPPFHRRGPTGLHRTQIAKMKNQNRKNASDDRPKLFTNCKFRMVFVALIPVINYNAQIAFKRR